MTVEAPRRRPRGRANDALYPLEALHIETASNILADAFLGDPFFEWLIPHETERRAWLVHFMRGNTWLARRSEARLVSRPPEAEVGDISGTILAYPPGLYPNPRLDELRFIARVTWHGLGKVTFDRIKKALRVFEDMSTDHPKEPHWYISTLGVAPTAQGRGLGRKLVEGITSRADEDGLPTWLETGLPANLGFYAHLGFEVKVEWSWDGVPPIWGLMRPVGGA